MEPFNKRFRGDASPYLNSGRGRERSFNRSPPEWEQSDRRDGRDGFQFRGGRSPRGRGGFNGGGGGFNGGRGGFNGGGGGGNFHKAAGGDFQRMPASVEHKILANQKLSSGTEGMPIELVGNFYRFLHSDVVVYHYDIDIVKVRAPIRSSKGSNASPVLEINCSDQSSSSSSRDGELPTPSRTSNEEEPMSSERREAQDRFIKKFADKIVETFVKLNTEIFKGVTYAFDGLKNMYTTKQLKFESNLNDDAPIQLIRKFEVDIEGRPAYFQVAFKLADKVSLNEAVQFYNGTSSKPIAERVISIFEIIFRFVISKSYASHQRKFFDLSQVERSPKVKICDFVQGFINSVRPTEFGLALNVHLKTSCTITQSFSKLTDLISGILSVSERDLERLSKQQLFAVNKIVRHLRVITKHSSRPVTYTIDAIVDKLPQDAFFDGKNGKKLSILDYFQTEYKIRLSSLPLVRCSGRNKLHLPMELCYLQESQFLNKNKFDQNIERELLFKSTHAPNVYFHKVAKIVQQIQDSDSSGILKSFGLELIPKAARFEGRVLPAPQTISANNRDQFFKPGKPVEWSLFVLDTRMYNQRDLESFEGQMQTKARELGLPLPKASAKDFVEIRSGEDIRKLFYNVTKKTNSELVFIGIPLRHQAMPSADIYSIIKHYCDQKFGLISQCFKADILKRIPPGYFDTFLLKVNGKLNGQNTALDPAVMKGLPFDTSRTMLMGIDVNHPGDTERVLSSVAAAVGSCDSTFSRYNASIRVQRKERNEMVMQLDEMVTELLEQYNKRNKRYPKNVIVFRDGVSEGQFNKVEDIEMPLIKKAFSKTGKHIALTLIVVQKRHHTRFALSQQNANGRKPTYNVPSGTVVDKAILEPYLKAFYLNSHFSPLGTSKPTKYIILRDDLKLSSDNLQRLCFYACFNCIRTRNVIAIPTPVRYADLCAYRAKLHIEAQRALDDGGITSEADLIASLNEKAQLHEEVKRRLFYC